MSTSSQDADAPRNASRTGQVRLTEAGETEVFDGVGWRPLASIYQDPQEGNRRSPEEAQHPAAAVTGDRTAQRDPAASDAPSPEGGADEAQEPADG